MTDFIEFLKAITVALGGMAARAEAAKEAMLKPASWHRRTKVASYASIIATDPALGSKRS